MSQESENNLLFSDDLTDEELEAMLSKLGATEDTDDELAPSDEGEEILVLGDSAQLDTDDEITFELDDISDDFAELDTNATFDDTANVSAISDNDLEGLDDFEFELSDDSLFTTPPSQQTNTTEIANTQTLDTTPNVKQADSKPADANDDSNDDLDFILDIELAANANDGITEIATETSDADLTPKLDSKVDLVEPLLATSESAALDFNKPNTAKDNPNSPASDTQNANENSATANTKPNIADVSIQTQTEEDNSAIVNSTIDNSTPDEVFKNDDLNKDHSGDNSPNNTTDSDSDQVAEPIRHPTLNSEIKPEFLSRGEPDHVTTIAPQLNQTEPQPEPSPDTAQTPDSDTASDTGIIKDETPTVDAVINNSDSDSSTSAMDSQTDSDNSPLVGVVDKADSMPAKGLNDTQEHHTQHQSPQAQTSQNDEPMAEADLTDIKEKIKLLHGHLSSIEAPFASANEMSSKLIKEVRQLQIAHQGSYNDSHLQAHELRTKLVTARKQFIELLSLIDLVEETLESEYYEQITHSSQH